MAEMLDIAADAHLIENSVRAALGEELVPMSMPKYKGNVAEVILHANDKGLYKGLSISEGIKPYVIQEDLWVTEGEMVDSFTGANQAIGTLVFNFPSKEMLEESISNISTLCKVIVECDR